MWRRYEYTHGTSNKFWEIERSGNQVTTWWGRIGHKSQTSTKTYLSEWEARDKAIKITRAKTSKGYVLVAKADRRGGASKMRSEPKRPAKKHKTRRTPDDIDGADERALRKRIRDKVRAKPWEGKGGICDT